MLIIGETGCKIYGNSLISSQKFCKHLPLLQDSLFLKNKEMSQINNIYFYLKKLETVVQNKLKASRIINKSRNGN